jgi:DNA-binding transcriptional regulator YiaG
VSEGTDQAQEPANGAAYFGEETRALRETLGLSQGAFADRLHYQQAQVSWRRKRSRRPWTVSPVRLGSTPAFGPS